MLKGLKCPLRAAHNTMIQDVLSVLILRYHDGMCIYACRKFKHCPCMSMDSINGLLWYLQRDTSEAHTG